MAQTKVPKGVAKAMATAHTALYKALGGRVVGGVGGAPVNLLTTTGRKSRKARTTPLIMGADGDDFVVIASFSGHDVHPAWYFNLQADPHATVTVGKEKIAVKATDVDGPRREELWEQMVGLYSDYDDYAAVTDREIPVVLLERV